MERQKAIQRTLASKHLRDAPTVAGANARSIEQNPSAHKTKGSTPQLAPQVGKALAHYKMGKFVEWEIKVGRLEWHFHEARMAQEKLFDGF